MQARPEGARPARAPGNGTPVEPRAPGAAPTTPAARLAIEQALVGARAVVLLVLADDLCTLRWQACSVEHAELAASWSEISLEADLPACTVFETGEPQWFASSADLLAAYPKLAAAPLPGAAAVAVVPVAVGGVPVGVWIALLPEPFAFTATRRRLMEALAAEWGGGLADRVPLASARRRGTISPAGIAASPPPDGVETRADLVLGSAFDALVVAAAVSGTSGRYLAVNPAAAGLFGRTRDELLTLGYADLTHPEDTGADDAATERLIRGESIVRFRKRFLRPDGTAVPVEATLVALRSPTGRWIGTLAQYSPADTELLERTAWALFDALPVGVAVFDLEQRYLAVNATLAQLNGLPVAEHLGRTVHELLPEPSASSVASVLDEVASTGESRLSVQIVGSPAGRPDLEVHTETSWVPILDADGQVVLTAAVVVDRTAQARAAEAEERRRHTVDALIGSLPVPVALVDPGGVVVHVNEALAALTGTAPEAHLGRRPDELYPEAVARTAMHLTREPREVRRIDLVEGVAGDRHLRITAFPVVDEGWGFAVEDRTDATRARRRVQALADIAARLTATADFEEIAGAVQEVVGAELGAFGAGTVLVEHGQCRFVTMSGYPSDVVARWERFGLDVHIPITHAFTTRAPVWVPEQAVIAELYPAMAPDAVAAGVHAAGCVPLVADGQCLGVLAISWTHPRVVTDEERDWCQTLAGLLAQTLLRARQNERDRHAAEVLQRSLLPRRLDPPPWLDAGAAYRAAGEATAGGDLYDLVPLPSGGVAAVVADICGRGVEAAAATAAVRHTLRAVLVGGADPEQALAAADAALQAFAPDALTLATALVVLAQPPDEDGAVRATVAAAGHPAPLVRRSDGAVEALTTRGRLLGLPGARPRPVVRCRLHPGDVLVAYTDGLTDAPHPRLEDADIARLVTIASGIGASDLPAWLLGRAGSRPGGGDDTAVIALGPPPRPPDAPR